MCASGKQLDLTTKGVEVTQARIQMFLDARDRARVRKDYGIVRATTADLRRLGVPDNATLADPTGKQGRRRRASEDAAVERHKPGPKPRQRCEHGSIADRCPACNEEVLAS